MNDRQTDNLIKQLHAAWDSHSNDLPDYSSLLERCPKSAQAQLDFLLIDVRHRRKERVPVPINEYLRHATELASDEACRFRLLRSELEHREACSDTEGVKQLLDDYPELAMTIQEGTTQPSSDAKDPSMETQDGSQPSNPEQVLPSFDSISQRIGRYQIEKLLGEGGFGSVYLATDTQLDRKVAIKLLRAGRFATRQQARTFLEEASSTAKLNHPSIVTLHDIGQCDDGSYYVVMEYVEGQSMAQRLADHSLTMMECIETLIEVARALGYSHRRGFVHRDLKPANILIDSEGRCRVADFGLAVHEDVQRMRAGEVAGTPAYMSPEQVRGEAHLLDGRTDIWSLGVILYQVLTDRLPFRGSAMSEVFAEIQHRRPRPPRQINRNVLPVLEQICLKCLASDIEARYRSAEDVAEGLMKALPLLEPVSETPFASRGALIAGGLCCLGGGGLMCLIGGLFVWITWLALYGPFGAACSSGSEFFTGLVTFAVLSSPLFIGLPLMILGLWLCLVQGGGRASARYMSGKAVASLAFASMTPMLNLIACIPALIMSRGALKDIRQRYPRVRGRMLAYLGTCLAIAGTVLSFAFLSRVWFLVTAYQAYDRGSIALQKDEIDNAIFEATLATNRFPDMAVGWKLRGEARLKRAEPKLAETDLTRAIAIYRPVVSKNPQQNDQSLVQMLECYRLRAEVYDQLGNAERASEDRKQFEYFQSFSSDILNP